MPALDRDLLADRRESERSHWVDRLVRHGMTVPQAEALVEARVDLHAVQEALEAGCDPETAFDIFS